MTRRLAAQGLAGPEQAESLLSVASALAQGVATPGEGLALDALQRLAQWREASTARQSWAAAEPRLVQEGLLRSGVGVHLMLASGLFRGSDVVDRGLGEWFPGAVQERLSEQPTRRTKALPGAKYSPDEFTHFPDQPADHDTESSRA